MDVCLFAYPSGLWVVGGEGNPRRRGCVVDLDQYLEKQ